MKEMYFRPICSRYCNMQRRYSRDSGGKKPKWRRPSASQNRRLGPIFGRRVAAGRDCPKWVELRLSTIYGRRRVPIYTFPEFKHDLQKSLFLGNGLMEGGAQRLVKSTCTARYAGSRTATAPASAKGAVSGSR